MFMFREAVAGLAMLLNGAAADAPPAPQPAPVKVVRVAKADTKKAPKADQVVQRVQQFYNNTNRFTALFRQHYTNTVFNRTEKHDGKVYIKKPGKMRWDYYANKKTVKSFISDGKRLWAVEHDNKQVFRKDLDDNLLPVAITFLYGQGNLLRDFDAKISNKDLGKPGDLVLELTPKQPSAQYKTLWLVVDPSDYSVKRSVVLEASGNTNAFTFYKPDLKKNVADTWFVFNEKASAVKNYRIIDERPAQRPKR